MCKVVVDYAPTEADNAVVREGIVAFNESILGERDKEFSIFLKNDLGKVGSHHMCFFFNLFVLFITIPLSAAPFYLKLQTSAGDLVAELYPDVAPQTVMQISTLVKAGLYDSTPFFRLERNFVLQTAVVQGRSLPLTSEQRALIHRIPAEFSSIKHERGILSLARQDHDVNSGESSFSILLAEAPHLDGKYTIFGRLVAGWETLEKIESMPRNTKNQPEFRIEICKAEILE